MLELKNLYLNYSYKSVLQGINLTFEYGKIYSLLGENGAGKSSLAKIICGDIKQTDGEIYLDGKQIFFNSPKTAIKNGICCVHQRPLLSKFISIKDNLRLGNPHFNKSKCLSLFNHYLPNISLNTLIKDLTPSQCFFTALISALLKNPKILILDEPSDNLKQTLPFLAKQGLMIIIITHTIKEALDTSNEVILLKGGRIIQKSLVSETSENEIKSNLFDITKTISHSKKIINGVINEDIIFQLRQTRNKSHINYIPSDKTFRASNPSLTILQMLTSHHTNEKQSMQKQRALNLLKKAQVSIQLKELCSNLSGGMLQRLILEREIAENPKLLILFNPTQGLDVEATERLYSRLDELSNNGTIVIISITKTNTSIQEEYY